MRLRKIFLCLAGTVLATSVANASIKQRAPVSSLLEQRHKNVVIQDWDLSCGAAALTTLLRYQHGIDVTEKEVALAMIGRPEYVANPELIRLRQGFSLLDLKLFADSTGLVGNGFGGLDYDDLLLMAPVLVPVNFGDYNHFVVFRGAAGNRVLLADPAWGNRTMSKEEFLYSWFEIGGLGRVGFTVETSQPGTSTSENLLAPKSMDFVMIR